MVEDQCTTGQKKRIVSIIQIFRMRNRITHDEAGREGLPLLLTGICGVAVNLLLLAEMKKMMPTQVQWHAESAHTFFGALAVVNLRKLQVAMAHLLGFYKTITFVLKNVLIGVLSKGSMSCSIIYRTRS